MKNHVTKHHFRVIIFYAVCFLGVISQVKAVFIQSTLEDEKQRINIFYTERVPINPHDREKICKDNFSSEEFDHDDIYREVKNEKLSDIIDHILEDRDKLGGISDITFNFYNISTKTQLVLMLSYMNKFIGAMSSIFEGQISRIKELNVSYYYFDDPASPLKIYLGRWGWTEGTEKPKTQFEQSVEEFKELKRKIIAQKRERVAERRDIEGQFFKDNYPKANIYKGEDSSGEDD